MTKNYIKKAVLLMLGFMPIISFAATTVVTVTSNQYTPANITINLGDTVRFQWVNGNHPTVSDDNSTIPLFQMNSGNSVQDVVLSATGVVPYYCVSHGAPGVGMAGVITVNPAPVSGLLFTDDFSYVAGTTLLSNGYNASGNPPDTSNKQKVTATGLSYIGSPSSNIGNAVALKRNGEDVNKAFTTPSLTSGTVYASMLVRVDTARASGDYFFNFGPTPIGGDLKGRIFVKPNGTGIQFGVTKSTGNTAAIFDPTVYTIGTTYLLVARYAIIAGAANDEFRLYVNPTLGGTEPTTGNAVALSTEADAASIGSYNLRQGSATNAANLVLDGIRIGTTYASVTPGIVVALDPIITFSPVSGTVSEATANFNLGVAIANANANATDVNIVAIGGTGFSGTDYTFTSPVTITFPASSTATISVPVAILNDLVAESLETVTFVLRNATNNASIGVDSIFTLSINDDDNVAIDPTVSFASASGSVSEATSSFNLTVAISDANTNPTDVNVVITGGTGLSGTDYTFASPVTVSFPANSTVSILVPVAILNDLVAESLETVTFALRNATNNATIGADSVFTLSINDDDNVVIDPTVSFSSISGSVSEATASFNLTVAIADANSNATNVSVILKGGTATSGTDFTFTSPQVVTFPANSTVSINVPVSILNDLVGESLETLSFVLRNTTNSAIIGTDSVFTLSISDDDIPVPPTTFLEDFSYTAGSTLLSNGYNLTGTNVINPQTVTSSSLVYPGSPSTNVGNSLIVQPFGQDVNKSFRADSIVAGDVYASMFVKIDTARTGDYFFHLGTNPAGVELRGRVFVKSSGTGVQFGVSKAGGAEIPVYNNTVYTLGSTNLLVLKYSFVTGATNDVVKLFVNPALGQPEPATASATAISAEPDASELATFGIRQGTTASASFLTLDGIRIATTFENVTPGTTVVPNDPTVGFASAGVTISENSLMADLAVNIIASNANATSVTVSVKTTGTTATAGSDYTFTTTTVTFPAGSSAQQIVMANIINDAITEGAETIVFRLSNATNSAAINADSIFTVNITDDDLPALAVTPIATLRVNDANGNPTFPLTTRVRVRGAVYGVNLRPAGLQITIIDQTAGIGVFESATNLGYTVLEGDSIEVFGVLSPFNGLNQINPDSIRFISSGNLLKTASIVSVVGEATESDLVQIKGYTIVNPATWTSAGSGFTAKFSKGTDTVDIRVDADVDLFSTPVPVGPQDITGLGGQFDNSDPKNSGYQLLPRRATDVTATVGLANLSRTEVSIYPNPVNDVLNIRTVEPIVSLSIINMLGQTIYSSLNTSNTLQIETTSFAKGIYVVKVQTAKGVRTEKIKVN